MEKSALPIQKHERAQILDVLRGLAILGIFLNNIYGFSGYGKLTEEDKKHFSTYTIDRILNFLQVVLVEGKFYSLFSLLFGIGFSIILIKNQQKGINALKIFYRRLIILLLIGAAHLYFVWEGDILLLYALIGLLLPLFRNCSNRALLVWAAVLILSPVVIDAFKVWLQFTPGQFIPPVAIPIDEKNGMGGETWRTYLYGNNGWSEWWTYQQTAFMYRYSSILDSNRIPKVLGLFLLGFYAGRKMIYVNLQLYKPLFKKLMLWGFAIGMPFSIAMAWFEGDGKNIYRSVWGMADTISYALGVVPLSLAYAAALCLFWLKTKGLGTLKIFAPVGRMALTNYLMQTIIGSLVFYGVGFSLGQKFGLVYLFPVAIVIYMIQVFYSTVWLRYFEYGPMEWIWRQLTYGKKLPLRKKQRATSNPEM